MAGPASRFLRLQYLGFVFLAGLLFAVTYIFLGRPRVVFPEPVPELLDEGTATNYMNYITKGRGRYRAEILANMKRRIPKGERSVRNCITGDILFNTVALNEPHVADVKDVNFKPQSVESDSERQASFQKVFKVKEWGKKAESVSGDGSSLTSAQEEIAILHSVIGDLKFILNKPVITILDVPCGDMNWMHRFLETRDDVNYTGVDIVPEIITDLKKKFVKKSWQFVHHDIVAAPLNNYYDLIHCRHLLQHLTNRDILTALQHLSASGSRFLLTTTYPTISGNSELNPKAHSRYRLLNLGLPPFSLTQPLCYNRDRHPQHSPTMHFTGLWQLPLSSIRKCGKSMKNIKIHGVRENFHSCNITA